MAAIAPNLEALADLAEQWGRPYGAAKLRQMASDQPVIEAVLIAQGMDICLARTVSWTLAAGVPNENPVNVEPPTDGG